MMPQGGRNVASGEGGLGYGVCYHRSCNWPAFLTAETGTLGLYSQTRRIMLMIPPQTKVLGLFATPFLSHYACDQRAGLSLSDLAAFYKGRKTEMSFLYLRLPGVFILEIYFI